MNIPSLIIESAKGNEYISLETAEFAKRKLYLTQEVNGDSIDALIKAFHVLDADKPGERIYFYINSPGGSVSDGLALYDTIRILKSPVTTICQGSAASMGAMLFLAGDERLMLPHSKVMIHDASYGQAEFSGMKPDEIQKKTNDLMETCKVLRAIVAERTGKSLKEVEKKMREDSYFNLSEAMEFGLATGEVTKILGA